MRVLETLFLLTILLSIVFGMRGGRPSSSFQGNVGTEQPQEETNIEPRGRPQIRPLFQLVGESLKIVKQEVYYENEFYTKIVDENGITQHFKEENEKLENSFNEEFVTLFFKELIKARNIYREALIKQKLEKEKKNSIRTSVSARKSGSDRSERLQQFSVQTTKKFTPQILGREDEDFETYSNSKLHQNDKEIFDNFHTLVYYKPYDCIAKKDLYNHDELENSFKISENNTKNGFTELNRIYALNKAIKSLCEFKNFSAVKHESLLKKFLESKGSWENQGSRNQAFEEEIYQTSSLPVDETYFEMSDSISVDIERFSNNITNDVIPINNASFFLDKEVKAFYPKALILLPTRELAQQTYREVLKLTYRTPLVPALVHGGHNNYAPQHGCDILVATPLRLIEMMKNSVINLSQSTFSVMDESDRLLDSSFAHQTGEIITQLPAKEERTTGRLSIQNRLKHDHFNCLAFHGDVGPKERKENLSKFKSGTIRLLIASDVLARGIDIGDITHVINFDTPEAYQNYVHRIGRTARVGREGTSITFVNEQTKIIMDLYNSIENKNVFPQEMSNRVNELKQKEELSYYNQQIGGGQLDPYRSSYSGGSQRYLLGNPDMFTHEVETYIYFIVKSISLRCR
uniref:RNA helicase n=1 Tax=Meloidogyne floridensis TaxID=298350 RepID=A0A915NLP2_9BILA